jgi:hypothetical protein
MTLQSFIFWPDSPALSVVVWMAGIIVSLYLVRTPAHQFILSVGRLIHNAMRLSSRSVLHTVTRLENRNKEVLLAAGRGTAEKLIEREFERVNAVVKRDLQGYPGLHRELSDLVTRIDEDYRESIETPPSPPGWTNAIEAVANIPSQGDALVANMLGEIKKTLERHHKTAMVNYRESSKKRHSLLRKMMPYWRELATRLDTLGKTIVGLQERVAVIDNKMDEYEEIVAKTDKAERALSSSFPTQFAISGFFLLIAIGGAVVNFNLIALPMSEMVGGGSYIGSFKTSNIAALVIILVEMAMGLYLMEALRITRLFSIIGRMDDKLRQRMILVTLTILVVLAGVESALAFMRDLGAVDMQQSLSEVQNVKALNRWIPTAGQMVMGFILPLALSFVAIPLESFVHSSRTGIGMLLIALLRSFAFSLRLFGNVARYAGQTVVKIYDMLIFPPLWVERLFREKKKQPSIHSFCEGDSPVKKHSHSH